MGTSHNTKLSNFVKNVRFMAYKCGVKHHFGPFLSYRNFSSKSCDKSNLENKI